MKCRPEWLKQRVPDQKMLKEMEKMLRTLSLNTVCESANCPNLGTCFENKTATFMIMGSICTRGCKFCAVEGGVPDDLDPHEPLHVAMACKTLELKHVVVTSVTRDDLEDGGARHFAKTVKEIRQLNPNTTIELLIPDLKGNWKALKVIVESKPDILNHNVETVPSLYQKARPEAIYERSVEMLNQIKVMDSDMFTKTGLMLGLGETDTELIRVMEDLLEVGCDILTLGQYLAPSSKHVPVHAYIEPEKFDELKAIALEKGFKHVASGPLVRSSYKAFEGMEKLKKSEL